MRTSVGSYQLTGLLGEGGMGAVFRANHTLLGRPAAIKLLLPELSRNQDIVNRFFNEARAATAIRHPGIVEIYDFGYVEDGSAYIAMELLDGESLATRLANRRVLPANEALWVIRQIAGALGAAHARGIVHRDLKPDNVFLVRDPEVPTGERIKLLDFGIAKLVGEPGSTQKTRTGSVMGTPTYMAPEQCRGVAIDLRADLYSLGCILFEMVCGRVPFTGEGVGDVLAAHIHVPVPAPRSIAYDLVPEVEQLILHLLAKDPAHRPGSAEQVIAAIDALVAIVGRPRASSGVSYPTIAAPAFAAGTAPSVPPPTTLGGASVAFAAPGTLPPPRSRRGMWIAIGGAIAAATVIAVVASTSGGSGGSGSGGEPVAAAPPPPAAAPPPPAAPKPEPPKPEPPKPAPAKPVSLVIDTTPPGANVLEGTQVLGVTPLRLERPSATGTVHLVVRLDGYQELPMDVPGDASVDRQVVLTKLADTTSTKKPRPKSGKQQPEDRNAGVNPF